MPRKTRAEIIRQLNYVTNLALAYQQANQAGRTADAARYAATIADLADGRPGEFHCNPPRQSTTATRATKAPKAAKKPA